MCKHGSILGTGVKCSLYKKVCSLGVCKNCKDNTDPLDLLEKVEIEIKPCSKCKKAKDNFRLKLEDKLWKN